MNEDKILNDVSLQDLLTMVNELEADAKQWRDYVSLHSSNKELSFDSGVGTYGRLKRQINILFR